MRPEKQDRIWSLRRHVGAGLAGYILLLFATILLHGYVVSEHTQRRVRESLLHAEFDHLIDRSRGDAGSTRRDDGMLQLFTPGPGMPAQLASLPPGIHGDVVVGGRERMLLVRDVEGERWVLALDTGGPEHRGTALSAAVLIPALLLVALLSAVSIRSVGRLVRPPEHLTDPADALDSRGGRQRLPLAAGASRELTVTTGAMNRYPERNEHYIKRERAFLDSASHELRTPIAVIAGAAQNALNDAQLAATTRVQILRIQQTADEMENLIALLLILARDPLRLTRTSERVALHELLPHIVEDHRYLCAGKALHLHLGTLEAVELAAPPGLVRAAIGNLLRNAIENSDHGCIVIAIGANGVVRIDDPGRGLTAEEISAIYSRLARGGERDGDGIGLALIGRLCEHLGWRLEFVSRPGEGSQVTLDLSRSRAPG